MCNEKIIIELNDDIGHDEIEIIIETLKQIDGFKNAYLFKEKCHKINCNKGD